MRENAEAEFTYRHYLVNVASIVWEINRISPLFTVD
jgi:hypothetical protein